MKKLMTIFNKKAKKEEESWTSIHSDFTPQLQKKWERMNFTYQEAKEWIQVGKLEPQDVRFARYLKSRYTPEEYLNHPNIHGEGGLEDQCAYDTDYVVNAQKWLDEEYPKEKRKDIKTLDIRYTGYVLLEDDLKLEGFINLEELDCSQNEITSLDLSDCQKLTKLVCQENYLDDTNFLKTLPNKEKLTHLDISNNEFYHDLTFLKEFANLRYLNLKDNKFYGSLSSLKSMTKLKELEIRGTNIDSGLEYLWINLITINYSKDNKEIYRQLQPYKNSYDNSFYLAKWRWDNRNLILKTRIDIARKNLLGNLELTLTNHHASDERVEKGLQIFIFEMEEKIKEAAKKLERRLEAEIEISTTFNNNLKNF